MGDLQPPVAGRDYPRSFSDFDKFFGDEAACRCAASRKSVRFLRGKL
jgi:hypothetical protein